jgi:YhcH/YjgK/YiaL family protein
MIIDSIKNADRYLSLHPLFKKAFEYIRSQDFTSLEVGKYEIADGLLAIVSNKEAMTQEESVLKFECHNKNIDIQLCIKGNESIGWKPRADCKSQKGEYNQEKDVLFFNDSPDMYFQLKDEQFAIFFPEDVHAPMIGEGLIKKMVIKVRID